MTPTPLSGGFIVPIPVAALLMLLEAVGGSVEFTEDELYMRQDEANKTIRQTQGRDNSGSHVFRYRIRDRSECGEMESHPPHQYSYFEGIRQIQARGGDKVGPPTWRDCEGWE